MPDPLNSGPIAPTIKPGDIHRYPSPYQELVPAPFRPANTETGNPGTSFSDDINASKAAIGFIIFGALVEMAGGGLKSKAVKFFGKLTWEGGLGVGGLEMALQPGNTSVNGRVGPQYLGPPPHDRGPVILRIPNSASVLQRVLLLDQLSTRQLKQLVAVAKNADGSKQAPLYFSGGLAQTIIDARTAQVYWPSVIYSIDTLPEGILQGALQPWQGDP